MKVTTKRDTAQHLGSCQGHTDPLRPDGRGLVSDYEVTEVLMIADDSRGPTHVLRFCDNCLSTFVRRFVDELRAGGLHLTLTDASSEEVRDEPR